MTVVQYDLTRRRLVSRFWSRGSARGEGFVSIGRKIRFPRRGYGG